MNIDDLEDMIMGAEADANINIMEWEREMFAPVGVRMARRALGGLSKIEFEALRESSPEAVDKLIKVFGGA